MDVGTALYRVAEKGVGDSIEGLQDGLVTAADSGGRVDIGRGSDLLHNILYLEIFTKQFLVPVGESKHVVLHSVGEIMEYG